jgi:hypothetical protein
LAVGNAPPAALLDREVAMAIKKPPRRKSAKKSAKNAKKK